MEDGANIPSYPMNIINLAPLDSAKKKQKEHKENGLEVGIESQYRTQLVERVTVKSFRVFDVFCKI